MEEILTNIAGYIAILGPAVASILTTIVLGVKGIKSFKDNTKDSINALAKQAKRLGEVNNANIEVKDSVQVLSDKIDSMSKQNDKLLVALKETNKKLEAAEEENEKLRKEFNAIKNQLKAKKEN